MKSKILLLLAIITIPYFAFSQKKEDEYKLLRRMPKDQLILSFTYENWLNTPDNMEIEDFSNGFEISSMYPLFLKDGIFSMAMGFGFCTHNIRSNSTPMVDNLGVTSLVNIPKNLDSNKNKLFTSYFDVPLEIRIRTRPNSKNKNFRIAFGVKAGYLLNSHIKYKGQDYRLASNNPKDVKFKEYNVENILPYRYGATARIGYGQFHLNAYYSLSGLFEENKGPEVIPFSVGITYIPY